MRVLIVRNNSNHDALDASMLLVAYFTTQSIECAVVDVSEFDDEAKRVELERMARSVSIWRSSSAGTGPSYARRASSVRRRFRCSASTSGTSVFSRTIPRAG